jgi:hypothetical protein
MPGLRHAPSGTVHGMLLPPKGRDATSVDDGPRGARVRPSSVGTGSRPREQRVLAQLWCANQRRRLLPRVWQQVWLIRL